MTEWQPIETAPKDGERIDLWCVDRGTNPQKPRRRTDCYWGLKAGWNANEVMGWVNLSAPFREWAPTHWMPRPDAPK